MNWESYEELVKDIYQLLGRSSGVTIECWGYSCKVLGKSKVNHQIDILTSHSDGIHTYKTAIECKYWDRKVPKDDVMKLSEIISDADIEKGVLVSKSGFTPDARRIAKSKNISLVELRKPVDKDWNDSLKQFDIKLNFCADEISDYQFVLYDVAKGNRSTLNFNTSNAYVYIGNQDSLPIREFVEKIIRSNGKSGSLEDSCWTCSASQETDRKNYSVEFLDKTTVSEFGSDKKWKIRKLYFTVRETTVTENISINLADYVAMIMHSIFDDKKFAVFPSMEVVPFKP